MRFHKLAPLGGLTLLVLSLSGCNKLRARDELNKGVAAFKTAQYQAAIDHFQKAAQADPSLSSAQLYLATAYSQLFVPGGKSEDNVKAGKKAIEEYEKVLKVDRDNATAIGSIAAIYYNLQEFDKAKEYQRKRMQTLPAAAQRKALPASCGRRTCASSARRSGPASAIGLNAGSTAPGWAANCGPCSKRCRRPRSRSQPCRRPPT